MICERLNRNFTISGGLKHTCRSKKHRFVRDSKVRIFFLPNLLVEKIAVVENPLVNPKALKSEKPRMRGLSKNYTLNSIPNLPETPARHEILYLKTLCQQDRNRYTV